MEEVEGRDVVPAVRKDGAEPRRGRERTSVGVQVVHDGEEGGFVMKPLVL